LNTIIYVFSTFKSGFFFLTYFPRFFIISFVSLSFFVIITESSANARPNKTKISNNRNSRQNGWKGRVQDSKGILERKKKYKEREKYNQRNGRSGKINAKGR
jgi:hypothetical protein